MNRVYVDLPPGELDGVEIRKITVGRNDLDNFMEALTSARSTRAGEYTALYRNGRLWMSDTDAEWRDHWPVVNQLERDTARTVLINGLGIGLAVQVALDQPHVEHVDVVEIDRRVAELVGSHYARDPRVKIHVADAYHVEWPRGTRWDVAWHDVWPTLCTDNLDEMAVLHRKYGRRVGWQGSWGKELLRQRRAQERRQRWF